MRDLLDLVLNLASTGEPALPPGVLADVQALVEGGTRTSSFAPGDATMLPATILRRYDDIVLGRLHGDAAFERAATAVCRFRGAEKSRALAFLCARLRSELNVPGTLLSPGVLRGLLARNANELAEEWRVATIGSDVVGRMEDEYRRLCAAVRQAPRLLAPEDLFELEQGTAVRPFGQRLALRQTLQAAEWLARDLPRFPPRTASRRGAIATASTEEDQYPVGGYASISTRGSIESLLHSQLAYIEPNARPDLFDVKALRNELLYYARDESVSFRPRRTFLIVLHPDLAEARIKDAKLPFQRIVLALGLVVAAVRTWTSWLAEEGLRFEILLLDDPARRALENEKELLEILFRTERANERVDVRNVAMPEIESIVKKAARTAGTYRVDLSSTSPRDDMEADAFLSIGAEQLECRFRRPASERVMRFEEPSDAWHRALQAVLESAL